MMAFLRYFCGELPVYCRQFPAGHWEMRVVRKTPHVREGCALNFRHYRIIKLGLFRLSLIHVCMLKEPGRVATLCLDSTFMIHHHLMVESHFLRSVSIPSLLILTPWRRQIQVLPIFMTQSKLRRTE